MSKSLSDQFARQLASWLSSADWHYTTLLSSALHSIDDAPADIDEVINHLLEQYPKKPSQQKIYRFLKQNTTVRTWFRFSPIKPRVNSYSLVTHGPNQLTHDKLPVLNCLDDLSSWLNLTAEELIWLCGAWRKTDQDHPKLNHYSYHTIEKRRGGLRLLESPKTHLKSIQRKIHDKILIYVPVHSSAHGFVIDKGCLSHATIHSGKTYLITFDLEHYFQSVGWFPVYNVFLKLGYIEPVSKALANLCTHQCRPDTPEIAKLDATQIQRLKERHLAQGAPTSPVLSNAVMFHLDHRLTNLAKSLGMTYSRYADDLAFSTDKQRDWRFLEPLVGSICLEEGFTLNYRKSLRRLAHQRQKLTGIVVNKQPNIDRRYYDQLKAILTNCIRTGANSQNRSNIPHFEQHLLGRVLYVEQLNPRKGSKLKQLYEQIDFSR